VTGDRLQVTGNAGILAGITINRLQVTGNRLLYKMKQDFRGEINV
jgi:hypothetical protein